MRSSLSGLALSGLRGLAALMTSVLVLSACAASPTASSGSAPATVNFAELAPNASFAASYAAQGIGAFDAVEKQFNVDITFTTVGNAQDSVNAMLGGSSQVSVGALSSYLIVAAGGRDVSAVFAPFISGGGVLIGAKKYEQSRGSDLAKYAGGTFGYTREGSYSQLLMRFGAEKAGLDWNTLPHVAFGQPSSGIPLLQAGRVDIVAADPTTAANAIAAGQAYLVTNFADPTVARPIVGEQLGTVYGVNKSFATANPDLTRALVGALHKGLEAIKQAGDDPQAVLKLFPPEIQAKVSKGWNAAWALAGPGVVASEGTLSDKAVSDSLSFGQRGGLLTPEQAATAPKVVDNSFIKAVVAS